jgi:hypothetical protein
MRIEDYPFNDQHAVQVWYSTAVVKVQTFFTEVEVQKIMTCKSRKTDLTS